MSQYSDLKFVGKLIGVYLVHRCTLSQDLMYTQYGDLEICWTIDWCYSVYICTLYQDLMHTLYFATSPSLVVCYTRPAMQRAPGKRVWWISP